MAHSSALMSKSPARCCPAARLQEGSYIRWATPCLGKAQHLKALLSLLVVGAGAAEGGILLHVPQVQPDWFPGQGRGGVGTGVVYPQLLPQSPWFSCLRSVALNRLRAKDPGQSPLSPGHSQATSGSFFPQGSALAEGTATLVQVSPLGPGSLLFTTELSTGLRSLPQMAAAREPPAGV